MGRITSETKRGSVFRPAAAVNPAGEGKLDPCHTERLMAGTQRFSRNSPYRGLVPRTFLNYVGIRVTDLDRSLKFYQGVFGLKVVARGDNTSSGKGPFILLRDDFSGQKLELNFYAPGSKFATPYSPGEGLDHIAFRVEDLDRLVEELRRQGVEDAPGSPNHVLPNGHRVMYVRDPDENWIEIYEHPEERISDPPAGY